MNANHSFPRFSQAENPAHLRTRILVMSRCKSITLVAVIASASCVLSAQNAPITPAQAKQHVGEKTMVCGFVASTHYAAKSRGGPTFLNLDKPYPGQIFTILIWREDRPKFGSPEVTYNSANVCVTGIVASYRGVPEIIAREPSQIRLRRGNE